MEIKDKIVLITGSSDRVGKEIALTLARKSAKTAIHYFRNQQKAQQTYQEIAQIQPDALLLQGDIRNKNDWLRMRDALLKRWGRIDVLINNASVFFKTPFFETSEEDWQLFMDSNLKGAFLGAQVMGEIMFQQESGKIINIADVSADTVWPGYIPYCISKAGLVALTKGLAKALAPHVTVNAVSPGTVLLAEEYDENEENILISRTPLKRVGTPADIANTVAFLIEGSDFINGAIIPVDGGRSLN